MYFLFALADGGVCDPAAGARGNSLHGRQGQEHTASSSCCQGMLSASCTLFADSTFFVSVPGWNACPGMRLLGAMCVVN